MYRASIRCCFGVWLIAEILLCGGCVRRDSIVRPPSLKGAQGNWVDLQPGMELLVQNAYYRDGFPKRGVQGYLGTESARFAVDSRGIRLLSVEGLLNPHPREQLRVSELIPTSRRRHPKYRFFYAVVFSKRTNVHGSVLLGASSVRDLDRLTAALLERPDSVCNDSSRNCTVFPEMCTVSIDGASPAPVGQRPLNPPGHAPLK
jgi:hypothetical protein